MPPKVHDFGKSLAAEAEVANAPWLIHAYQALFLDVETAIRVKKDGWAQRGGIDRIVARNSGRTHAIQEKYRFEDYGDDVLLEYWSDIRRQAPGWVAKDTACDFVNYIVVPTRRCILLPFDTLRRAWKENRHEWVEKARRKNGKGINGFSEQRVTSRFNGREWTTVNIVVPTAVLFLAMNRAMQFCYPAAGAGGPTARGMDARP
jgi:hypothetical protein